MSETLYTGQINSICVAYMRGFITAEQRIMLIKPARQVFYENFKNYKKMALENSLDPESFNPKNVELNIMKGNNTDLFGKDKKCFPEIEQ